MDLNEILKLFSQFLNFNNNHSNQTNNSSNFKDFNLNNNFNNLNNTEMNTNENLKKEYSQTNQPNYIPNQNPYLNFPPPLNESAKINNHQTNNSQEQYNIYPQNYSINQNTQSTTHKINEENQQGFNLQSLIANFLNNPDSIKIIQQVLPLFQNKNNTGNSNFLTNLLGGLKTNKKENNTLNENNLVDNNDIDIDKLIRIDDV